MGSVSSDPMCSLMECFPILLRLVPVVSSQPERVLFLISTIPATEGFMRGKVVIGKNVFIGMNTLIVNAVNIGDGAIIGAGSIVNRDIPAGEIWGGNPARFIKKLNYEE